MGSVVEYPLVSADGVYGDPAGPGFMCCRGDACPRDGLAMLWASETMIMGRRSYELPGEAAAITARPSMD